MLWTIFVVFMILTWVLWFFGYDIRDVKYKVKDAFTDINARTNAGQLSSSSQNNDAKEDTLITKCIQSFDSCKDIATKKYDQSITLIEVEKFETKDKANDFFNTWSGLTQSNDLEQFFQETEKVPETHVSQDYNKDTGIISVSWNDPTNTISSLRVLVTKETMGGTTIIYDDTISGTSGTYTRNVSEYYGTLLLRAYPTVNDELMQKYLKEQTFPIVLLAVKNKMASSYTQGVQGALPLVLICTKEGDLIERSKESLGC